MDSAANKKRKLSTDEELTTVSTIENDHFLEHSATASSSEVSGPTIELPNVEAKVFELFLKFAYMGWYPFEIDALLPDRRMTNNLPQRSSPYPPVQARDLGQVEGSVTPSRADSRPKSSNNVPPATASPTITSLTQFSTIPPSVSAWLFAMSIGAFRFANHAMLHIHSGIGSYFQLTPHLIHFIWQHTPQHSILRRLIIDILLVHWTGSSSTTQCINRHPALNQHWMRLFDSHADLKSLFVLGLGSRKEVMAPEAYFVYPQMPKVAPSVSTVKPLGSGDSGVKEAEDVKPPQHGDGEEVVAGPSESKGKAAVVKSEEFSTDEGEISDADM
ncbi:hypothetical protein E8E13_004984 [Curvularia kusanoi]|uniref:BTB domain-containing protein n=1 Tax=Curvularia kusanoi TaxID=90978 RepID=A0A9P4WDI8_CURKU|nr:hypothetical protein E8E13_004984 [Curvularia kusanoi]